MESRQEVLATQRKWAQLHNLPLDNDGYVTKRNDNFFQVLSNETQWDLIGGDGTEFMENEKIRTKIFATHSSSALVCNVFEYWRYRERTPLASAMKLGNGIKAITFEQKLSMGMSGTMPNLDMFFLLDNGRAVAVESKFTEWMSRSEKNKFSDSYFQNGRKRWEEVGLPKCQVLAQKIASGEESFFYLDTPQLLKHALGLANMHSNRSQLIYLYYDLSNGSDIRQEHEEELNRFKKHISGELDFRSLTYQDLIAGLNMEKDVDAKYLDYLQKRYV